MSGTELKHRLLAILAADATGYSRLMAADDRATVAALDAARAVFRTQIESNQGRVIDMAGDSVLAVFETATGAVSAALAIQGTLNEISVTAPEEQQMRFRIGVHMGDVIEKSDGTVYGDGVNIAARLEGLADPGGITVSDSIHIAVRGRVTARFVDKGEQQVKNISHPVRAYAVQAPDPATAPSTAVASRAMDSHQSSSIAVLPFKVLSEDSSMVFLADGLAEDVIALLARVAGFVVISQASSFAFRHSDLGVSAVAQQLGVRYVVEGSVRPLGDRVRVSTQLTEAASGHVLWSGKFDAGRADTADLQEEITRGILSELEPELTRAEIGLIKRLRPENVDAWGCYHQAQGAIGLKGWTGEAMGEARTQLQRAFSIDPKFALAHAHFALMTAIGRNVGLIKSVDGLVDEAFAAAEHAIALDDGSSQVLGYAGCALADLGRVARGAEILTRSLELDPSNAQAHVAFGATQCLGGETEAGVEEMRYGMRISPRDRRLGFWGWALGSFLLRAGRDEEALREARLSTTRDPKLHLARILEAGVLSKVGRDGEAFEALRNARRLHPSLTLEGVAFSHGRRFAELIQPLWSEEISQ